jgi:hypothetical protein
MGLALIIARIVCMLYYSWRRRYEELGIEGLRPRSRRPHTSPNATSGEVIGKIVHLRKTYHFGSAKISMHLKRYHDLELSTSGVWRILKRLEMGLAAGPPSATAATSSIGSATRSLSPVTSADRHEASANTERDGTP